MQPIKPSSAAAAWMGRFTVRQKLVQLFQTLHPRNRHQMIAPEVAHFAFHSALLIPSRRIAELRLKAPVRAEGNEPLSLLPLIPAQNLLHRTLQVVVAHAGTPRRRTETRTRVLPKTPAGWRDSRRDETLRLPPSSASLCLISRKCTP